MKFAIGTLALVAILVTPAACQDALRVQVPLEVQVKVQQSDLQPLQPQPQAQYAPTPVPVMQVQPVSAWEYYAWLNANYRPVRGPFRRFFVGPYVRRSPWDPVFVSYYYR